MAQLMPGLHWMCDYDDVDFVLEGETLHLAQHTADELSLRLIVAFGQEVVGINDEAVK